MANNNGNGTFSVKTVGAIVLILTVIGSGFVFIQSQMNEKVQRERYLTDLARTEQTLNKLEMGQNAINDKLDRLIMRGKP